MVRSRRLELPRELPHSDLNAARLPVPPRPLNHRKARELLPCHSSRRGIPNDPPPIKPRAMAISLPKVPVSPPAPPEWRVSRGLVPYPEAVAAMEARVAGIARGAAPGLPWLLGAPPPYTP